MYSCNYAVFQGRCTKNTGLPQFCFFNAPVSIRLTRSCSRLHRLRWCKDPKYTIRSQVSHHHTCSLPFIEIDTRILMMPPGGLGLKVQLSVKPDVFETQYNVVPHLL